jgi:eukaryotic-like serine/threonine-protein kinase
VHARREVVETEFISGQLVPPRVREQSCRHNDLRIRQDHGRGGRSGGERARGGRSDATETIPLTSAGTLLGTAPYMSPEQARGENVDARSDLWSLGVLLYEMATGAGPFQGPTLAVIFEGVLSKTPMRVTVRNPRISLEFERIISKLMEKDREKRYRSAADLLGDLRRMQRDSASGATSSPLWSKPNPLPKYAAALLLLCAASTGAYFFFRPPAIHSLADLPFVNATGNADVDYLSDGISESLIDSLSRVPELRVISRNAVFRYKRSDIDALQVGRELNVRAVLTGRIARRGDALSISAELLDTRDNTQLWGEHYDRKVAEILSSEQDIAARISEKLRLRLSGEDIERLARHGTSNPEAYQLYLKGRYFAGKFTKDGLDKGLEYLRQAIAADPNYALAYDGLAYYYGVTADILAPAQEAFPKAKAAARKALELDDTLAEAHADAGSFLLWYDYDWPGAENELRRSIELNPSYSYAREIHGWYLTCRGLKDKGIAEGRKSQELDPLEPERTLVMGYDLFWARRYQEAADQLRNAIDLDPGYWLAHTELALVYVAQGKPREAIEAARSARKDEPLVDWPTAVLGMAFATRGDRAEAEKVLAELNAKAKRGWVPSYAFAEIYAGLGDKPDTLAALEKTYGERSWFTTFINVAPEFDFLRSEPRFQEIIRRMKFRQ